MTRTFIRTIQSEVARHYKLPIEVMREPDGMNTRLRPRAHPRQLAMCLSARLTNRRLSEIANLFERDRRTVFHGIRAAERRIANDPDTREAARTLTKQLLHESGLL